MLLFRMNAEYLYIVLCFCCLDCAVGSFVFCKVTTFFSCIRFFLQ